MNMITYFNELVTKNFNNYIKKYFNNINYAEKNGNFINYYNFMYDLDSFNNSIISQMIFMKEKIMLLYLVKLILKEDIIMIKTQINTFSLLIYF